MNRRTGFGSYVRSPVVPIRLSSSGPESADVAATVKTPQPMRRPSPAMLVALLALFVALGGPAQARRLVNGADIKKGTVRSAQIKDRTIALRDINPTVVRQLEHTPANSITEGVLINGAVTANKLGAGAVTAGKISGGAVSAASIADGAVTGAKIADGSLTTADVARFSGRFRVLQQDLGTIAAHACWRGEPRGWRRSARAPTSPPTRCSSPRSAARGTTRLMLTSRTSGTAQPSRFVLMICNPTDTLISTPRGRHHVQLRRVRRALEVALRGALRARRVAAAEQRGVDEQREQLPQPDALLVAGARAGGRSS